MWQESHQVVEYANWNDGEPNNFFGVEDCVFKKDDGWNDADCTIPHDSGFNAIYGLCEMDN